MADDRSDIALLYRRAGFGISSEELDDKAALGYAAAVDELVGGLAASDPGGDAIPVPTFTAYPAGAGDRTVRRAFDAVARKELPSLQEWWMDRMIVTSTPLREKLTLFWHGHFATGVSKVRDPKLMYLQNELFRVAGAGSFRDLVEAVAKDGAMMVWLDTDTDKKAHPNENFAREMMELFTLGIGNYTQDDVTSAARAFTGWNYDRHAYAFAFQPRQHDYGEKTFLGRTGDFDGGEVVDIVTAEPESARFVMAKLWSHFAYPVAPSDPPVSDLVEAYGRDLDITAVLRALFTHPAFLSPVTRTGLVKQPAELLVGAARALGLDARLQRRTGPAAPVPGAEAKPRVSLPGLSTILGQTLFDPPNVGGWGQDGYWLDTATSLARLQAALLLARRADLTAFEEVPPSSRLAAVASALGVDGWGATTAAALARVAARPVQLVALAINAPEYVLA